jgi:hypothetical protein
LHACQFFVGGGGPGESELFPGLPDFSWYNIPKLGKYTKLSPNIPNVHKIYQMAVK